MRISISLIAVVFGSVAVSLVSPMTPSLITRQHGGKVGSKVASIGKCPKDCWNEAAVKAKCDPNKDDRCLCGPFLDAVTLCTSQTCNLADNLAALNFLEPACN
ncbi:uncharacterized protein K460DRAFT_341652 [Cucurbitaria berberidis CBS 394.84]|uniref:CFEM domain-containing protein n=1 Tax=Cucurbitaria berberidis CBS 394.84 TaxID=1168544 RepID=A0A9P4L6N2_9PLEO|nr:uncharacterized protein K460DRAFT_341652 [Cucurbitaria berberidis CBS 394.84]KAF1843469.1 hypothetical protein K460DRAFT_341652 [Cucurbitaria berberidis CBS 394.84]